MRIAAPADKRFRRARVTPARRPRWMQLARQRAVPAALVLAFVIYAGYRATALALNADGLAVTRINVSGNSRISGGEVIGLLDGLHGANMLTVDLEAWRRKLLTSPWVADAAMRRVLPGTITVAISERQPMGIGRIGGLLYLVDDRGGIIDQFGPNYAEFDLPIIDGLGAAPGDDGSLVDQPRAEFATRVLGSMQARPDLVRRISELDVTDLRDAVVLLKGDTTQVRIGSDQFVDRLQSYLDLVPALRERMDSIDYVDVRFDERVYARPQRNQESSPSPGAAPRTGRTARTGRR